MDAKPVVEAVGFANLLPVRMSDASAQRPLCAACHLFGRNQPYPRSKEGRCVQCAATGSSDDRRGCRAAVGSIQQFLPCEHYK